MHRYAMVMTVMSAGVHMRMSRLDGSADGNRGCRNAQRKKCLGHGQYSLGMPYQRRSRRLVSLLNDI
jgi:hypothetical protein